jgi:membrane protein required for colicin V production
MNGVDLAIVVLLILCAVRGYGRGLIRECFGLLALVVGVATAVQFSAAGSATLEQLLSLPTTVSTGVAFVGIFVLAHVVLNLVGSLFDRLTGAGFVRSINQLVGAAFAAGKAAVVLGFILLFLHLLPFVPTLDQHIMHSRVGYPLVAAASAVCRVGAQNAQPDSPSQT